MCDVETDLINSVSSALGRSFNSIQFPNPLILPPTSMDSPRPSEPLLYPGENYETIAGFPTIYHYQPPPIPDSTRPLIVCVPGGLHLARMFYGGHRGSRPEDFLVHWLNKHGFGVLSLSYPLETDPAIMPATASGFRVPDWGRQAAGTTQQIMQHESYRSVVLIAWSMGGRMIVPFNLAAKELGLEVEQYISFAATPGISNLRATPRGIQCSPTGYYHVPSRAEEVFGKQLDEIWSLNAGREIIPREIYRREYLGGTPINLVGLRLRYDGRGAFVPDEMPYEEETRVFEFSNLPFISAIYPTSILDANHSLSDRATWGFLMTRHLESTIVPSKISPQKWPQVVDLVHSAPERLSIAAEGNHFFFVGERGARTTANHVVELLRRGSQVKRELSSLMEN